MKEASSFVEQSTEMMAGPIGSESEVCGELATKILLPFVTAIAAHM